MSVQGVIDSGGLKLEQGNLGSRKDVMGCLRNGPHQNHGNAPSYPSVSQITNARTLYQVAYHLSIIIRKPHLVDMLPTPLFERTCQLGSQPINMREGMCKYTMSRRSFNLMILPPLRPEAL